MRNKLVPHYEPINRKGIVVRDKIDNVRSNYVEAEALFRRSLDVKSDRVLSITKAIAVRNAALDRYKVAVERQSIIKPNAA